MAKRRKNKCYLCRLDDCPHYERAYQSPDDLIGDPWCLLANEPLPDEENWPFNCIAREELAALEGE